MIVAQARHPVFYAGYGIADTVNGRFDLLLVHVAMVLERLSREDLGKAAGQDLFDLFCADMDDNLREMGIGDLSVPKHMKRVGEAFYGRSQGYQEALAKKDDAALIEALTRNIYAGEPRHAATPLAAYIRKVVGKLGLQSVEALAAGQISFPDPVETLGKNINVRP